MPYSIRVIKEIDELDPKLKGVFFAVLEEIEKNVRETVKRSDFEELKTIVAELGRSVAELTEAQKRTEQRVNELTEAQKRTEQRVNELAEAQKRTEQRLDALTEKVCELAEAQKRTEKRVNELAEAQKRTEQRLDALTEKVCELAEAQKRTEQRVNELAEAQKRTEQRLDALTETVSKLTEAQKKTEIELRSLVREHQKTREILGGISDTVGYGLEDKIMPYIAAFARQEYNVEVSIVDRRYVTYPDGRHDEINIYAEGVKGGEGVLLVGECKARPSKKDVDRIAAVVKRLKAHLGLPIYTFMVGYTYTPDVERYLREKYPEIRPVKSFVFDMKYARTLVS